MATPLEWSIALRYLRSRRGSRVVSLISAIAIGGVVVGVAALVLIMGVMNGLQTDLREKILVGSPDVRVLTYGDALTLDDWGPLRDRVRGFPGVVAAAPFVITQGGISAGAGYAEGVYVYGLETEPVGDAVTPIRTHAVSGDFSFRTRAGQRRGAVLGRLLAQRLNVFPGDTVRLVAFAGARLSPTLGTFVPATYAFEVTGLFSTGMYEYDNGYVYLPLEAAQEFAALGTAVTGLEVRPTDRWRAPLVGGALADSLGYPYRTVDWQEQNRSLFQALKLEKLGMGVILLLIVLVAAFNIVSTLTMVVADKTREIGILRAMGLPAASVRTVFLLQGVLIGGFGTFLGLVLGLGASVAVDRGKLIALDSSVYFIDHLPVLTDWSDVAVTAVASLIIAGVATIWPARAAAALQPVEAIRHE
ncbi:MAG: ABC transporter permease [Gemmatimonadota bacterium]